MKSQVSGAFYRSLFDNMLDGLAYCQMFFDAHKRPVDFMYIRVSKNFEKSTGLKDAIGKKVTELVPGISISNPELFEISGRVSLTGISERFETYVEPLSRWFLVSVFSPKKKFFMAIFQNITSQKQINKYFEDAKIAARNVLEDLQVEKEKLAIAKAKDEATLASIGDGLMATDAEGKIVLVNKIFEKLLGWKESEVKGRLLTEVVPATDENGESIPSTERLVNKILAGSIQTTTSTTTYNYKRKDGITLPVIITISPILLGNKFIGTVGVFRDITKEKEIERAKSEFISIASHQLRTPVSGLSWLTEALQFNSQNLDPKQIKYVGDLAILSKRLTEIIEDLLDFSRIELGTAPVMEKHQIEIPNFIEEFIKEMEAYAVSKNHSIILKKEDFNPTIIEINKRALYNILQNLVSNGIDYSPANTAVTVILKNVEGAVKISISNKGPAIPKADQSRIFNKFYRTTDARKIKPEGTGLGLYVVKVIIEEIGGKIGFDSEEGQDTTFWFTIPLKLNNK